MYRRTRNDFASIPSFLEKCCSSRVEFPGNGVSKEEKLPFSPRFTFARGTVRVYRKCSVPFSLRGEFGGGNGGERVNRRPVARLAHRGAPWLSARLVPADTRFLRRKARVVLKANASVETLRGFSRPAAVRSPKAIYDCGCISPTRLKGSLSPFRDPPAPRNRKSQAVRREIPRVEYRVRASTRAAGSAR